MLHLCITFAHESYVGALAGITGINKTESGPIFLTKMECDSNDGRLLECKSRSDLGIAKSPCSHHWDATVHCEGIREEHSTLKKYLSGYFSVAFCNASTSTDQHGEYAWNRTEAESVLSLPCQYEGVQNDSQASRRCNEWGLWESVVYDQCRTYSESILQDVDKVSLVL